MITDEPSNARAHNLLGIIRSERGERDEALKDFNNAIATDVLSGRSYYNLGNHYLKCGDTEKAVDCYRTALGFNSRYVLPHLMLARIYEAQGKSKRSLEEYREVFRIEKEKEQDILSDRNLSDDERHRYRYFFSIKNTFNEGFLLEREGAYGEAIERYTDVLRKKPDFARAYYRRALCLLKSDDYKGAEDNLRKSTKLKPDIILPAYVLGDLQFKQGKLNEALDTFRLLETLAPDNVFLKDYIAGVLVARKRYEEAEKVYRRLIEIDPDYARAYEGLGNICLNLNRLDDAESYYKKAISLSQNGPDACYNLASLYARKGDSEKAMRWLRKSIRNGFSDKEFMRNDPNLKTLRDHNLLSEIAI